MRKFAILSVCVMMLSAPHNAHAADKATRVPCYEMIGQGDRLVGLQFAFGSLGTTDNETMVVLEDMSAKADYTLFAPSFEYAYKSDRTIGVRFTYAKAGATLDALSINLLSDGMTFDLSGYEGGMSSIGAALFKRNYYGIDKGGHFAMFIEESIGYQKMELGFSDGYPDDRTQSSRIRMAFNPGIIVSPISGVTVSASISLANLSYTHSLSYKGDESNGSRDRFGSRYGVDLTGINFGLSIHLK